jgi:hypothetical protein
MHGKVRRSPRVNKLFLTAYVNREGEEQKTPVSLGRTLDISAAGVGMEIYQEVQVGSAMDMEFDLQGALLTVQGKVVHARREGEHCYVIGVEFNEAQPQLAALRSE